MKTLLLAAAALAAAAVPALAQDAAKDAGAVSGKLDRKSVV